MNHSLINVIALKTKTLTYNDGKYGTNNICRLLSFFLPLGTWGYSQVIHVYYASLMSTCHAIFARICTQGEASSTSMLSGERYPQCR